MQPHLLFFIISSLFLFSTAFNPFLVSLDTPTLGFSSSKQRHPSTTALLNYNRLIVWDGTTTNNTLNSQITGIIISPTGFTVVPAFTVSIGSSFDLSAY